MTVIRIPVDAGSFISLWIFPGQSWLFKNCSASLGCVEQVAPMQRWVLVPTVSKLQTNSQGWLGPTPPLADGFGEVMHWAAQLNVSRPLCGTATACMICNLYPCDFAAWCYNITSAFGSLSIDFWGKWRAPRGGRKEWLKSRLSRLCKSRAPTAVGKPAPMFQAADQSGKIWSVKSQCSWTTEAAILGQGMVVVSSLVTRFFLRTYNGKFLHRHSTEFTCT